MPTKKKDFFKKMGTSLKEKAESFVDTMDEKMETMGDNFEFDIMGIQTAGAECCRSARETSGLATITIAKATELVTFGQELSSTLQDVCRSSSSSSKSGSTTTARALDASKFATIMDLVDGDKIKASMTLAHELSELSVKCADKSQDMIASMERGIDALPDAIEPFVENKMNKASSRGAKRGDPALPDIEGSVRDMQQLVEDVQNVNLGTVVSSGTAAFEGLRKNGELSKVMFTSIRDFAVDVESVSTSFRGFDTEARKPKELFQMCTTIAKDAWRCLRLSGMMKLFAEKVRVLIQWIISLFQMASSKLGEIWGSLANAKTVLGGCIKNVKESIRLCDLSKDNATVLRDTSKEICDHLKTIVQFKKSKGNALASIRELADGEEIILCLKLATGIDDNFSACTKQVIRTIDDVDTAIRSMPAVLKIDTDGNSLEESSGSMMLGTTNTSTITEDNNDDDFGFEDDNEIEERSSRGGINSTATTSTKKSKSRGIEDVVDISNDVRELAEQRSSIEGASAITLLQKSAEGFQSVNEKIGTCGDMITTSRGFADTSLQAIDSFNNGSWDLEVAAHHILELFEIRDAGQRMKVFVESVLELVRANIELLKAIRSKSKSGPRISDIASSLSSKEGIGKMAGNAIKDLDVDDIKNIGQGIGSLFKNFKK